MSILITGGAGYIGSHTCVELLNAGESIVVLDNFSNSKPEAIEIIKKLTGKDFPVYVVDLLNEQGVRQMFREQKIESVIHFAGLKAVGESVSIPLRYYHNNITGTLILCQAMAEMGCKRMVFSSSATVYGANNNVPFCEDSPASATNPYGSTKVMIERILEDTFAADSQWSIALLRYFNPVGAHESGELGENPNGIPNNLMPYICHVASGIQAHLNVYGKDYATPDGTGIRDYLHVADLSQGHLKALQYIRKQSGVEAINLGTGVGYSVLTVIHTFEQATGIQIPYVIAPRRPGDIAVCYANPAKAKELLGWEPIRSLAEMCGDSWRFAKRACK